MTESGRALEPVTIFALEGLGQRPQGNPAPTMPANSISHLPQATQPSAVKRKSGHRPPVEAEPSPGAGFESVLRGIRQPKSGQNIAAPAGNKLPAGDLQKFALGPHVKIITSCTPPPDEQSLLAFARAEGIDGALLELIMGKKDASPEPSDSSAPDLISPSEELDPLQAIAFMALAQAPIGLMADPVHTPIQDPATAAFGPTLPGSERVTAAPFPGVTETTGTTIPGSSSLPLPPTSAALNSVGTRAMFASATPSGSGKPADAPATAAGSITEIAAQPGTDNGVSSDVPGLPPRLAGTAVADGPSAPGQAELRKPATAGWSVTAIAAQPGTDNGVPTDVRGLPARLAGTTVADSLNAPFHPGPNKDGQMPAEAASIGQESSPDQAELLTYQPEQGQEGPAQGTLPEDVANLLSQDSQKLGKVEPDGSASAILLEADAPTTGAAQLHWAVGETGDSASAVAPHNHSQALGGVAQELDLGMAAPAHEETMQESYFRRSEQYQMLSDRVAEAIGQRLSAQIAKGVWQVSLQVSPRHLGKIDIRLGMRGTGTIDAEFNTSQQSTRDLLLNSLPKLKEVMAQSGMDLSSMDVRHEGASANGGNAHTRQPLPATAQLDLSDQQVLATRTTAPHTARVGADGLDVMV